MDIEDLRTLTESALEQHARYKVEHAIAPDRLMTNEFAINNLEWQHVPYGREHLDDVPDDRRGIYAFSIFQENQILPQHGYVLYIGIAGRDSKRSLRQRYRDYLNLKSVAKRARISRMISTWHEVLKFCFAPIDADVTSQQLQELEQQLNGALMPPFSVGDMEATLRAARRAFP